MGNRFSSSNASTTPAPFSSASPMELGAINEHKPLSAPVKEFCCINGLCMYCGEANHQVANCPNKNKQITGSLGTIMEEDMLYSRIVPDPAVDAYSQAASTDTYPLATIQAPIPSRHQSLLIMPIVVCHGDEDQLMAPAEAMVDTCASSNLVSRHLVDNLRLDSTECPQGEGVLFRLANNTVIANPMHEELLTLRIIETASFSLIFGMPWLRRHCPRIHFDKLQVEMNRLTTGRGLPVRYDNTPDDTTDRYTVDMYMQDVPQPPMLSTAAASQQQATTTLPPIQLPPVEFSAALTDMQQQLFIEAQNHLAGLDDWVV
ncbi:hypothetical protein MBANPS3_011467 [Mucor bainieri]